MRVMKYFFFYSVFVVSLKGDRQWVILLFFVTAFAFFNNVKLLHFFPVIFNDIYLYGCYFNLFKVKHFRYWYVVLKVYSRSYVSLMSSFIEMICILIDLSLYSQILLLYKYNCLTPLKRLIFVICSFLLN
jgi:hypothetical protein